MAASGCAPEDREQPDAGRPRQRLQAPRRKDESGPPGLDRGRQGPNGRIGNWGPAIDAIVTLLASKLDCLVPSVGVTGLSSCEQRMQIIVGHRLEHQLAGEDPARGEAHRARLTPERAGPPTYGRSRRVEGLRREEVALLAGISVEYYTRLERGNARGVSDDVLESVSRALQLGADSRCTEHARQSNRSRHNALCRSPLAVRRSTSRSFRCSTARASRRRVFASGVMQSADDPEATAASATMALRAILAPPCHCPACGAELPYLGGPDRPRRWCDVHHPRPLRLRQRAAQAAGVPAAPRPRRVRTEVTPRGLASPASWRIHPKAQQDARNRTFVLARPTGFDRADAMNFRIPIDGARIRLLAEGA